MYMRVRLTKKLADCLNGFDLAHARVGSVLAVSDRDGNMLIAEGWAVPDFPMGRAGRSEAHAADAERRRSRRPAGGDNPPKLKRTEADRAPIRADRGRR